MFEVSEAYKLAVADSHRKSKIRAEIKSSSSSFQIDDSDIIKDTVYVANQCTNGNEYEYGCTYAGECGITIKSDADRYSLYDAELKLFWSLWTGEAWEEIPLGVYYISEPNRINDKISIKALDGMIKLDVNVDEDTQGTMPQLLAYIAEKCGVELAQTDEELGAFVNGNIQLSVYEDKVDTYRDLVAYMCMLTCSFAIFDRYGKLRIVPYATEPCVTLGKSQRFENASFSDYTTAFRGVKARFIAEENYAPYEYIEDKKSGLVLDLGDNPILRGLPETKHTILNEIYNVLKDVSYTPCEIEMLGNPAIDLGDLITNTGVGKDDKTYISPVTYSYFTFRRKHKIKAVGGNPKLSDVKSKEGKSISSLEGGIASKSVIVKTDVNADNITFEEKEKEIAQFNFATTEQSKIIFLMTARMSLSLDGVLVIKFYTDAKLDEERIFRKYLERGEHFITLSELYATETNERHTISVRACMEYFESDSRRQDADNLTANNFLAALAETGASVSNNVVVFPTYEKGAIIETVATAGIAKGGVKAILYGQGIAGEGNWDGTINIVDEIEVLPAFTSELVFADIVGTLTATTQTPTGIQFTEELPELGFSGIPIVGIADKVRFKWDDKSYTWGMIYDTFTWESIKEKTWSELKGV